MWEYKIVVIPFNEVDRDPDELTEQYLTPPGNDGWEMVSGFKQSGFVGWVYTFKRYSNAT